MADVASVAVVIGPTAAGKTAVAMALQDQLGGPAKAQLISADSALVYRGMDIGTAKPNTQELAAYPGGSMFELGCHLIDPLLTILGKPTRVTPHNRRTFEDRDDLLDNCLAVFDFADATATIRSSLVEPDGGRRRQFVVCGTKGTLSIRPLEPPQLQLTLEEPAGGFAAGNHHVELASSPGRYHGAWKALWAASRNRRPLACSPDHDVAVQRAVLLASGFEIPVFGK